MRPSWLTNRRGGAAAALILLLLVAAPPLAGTPGARETEQQIQLPEGISALPELLEFVQADYPTEAYDADIQADVMVQISIDETGRITEAVPTQVILYSFDENDVLIEESVPPDADPYGFVPAALAALDQFLFDPALDDEGEPVAVALVWRYGFYLDEEEVAVEDTPADDETSPDDGTGETDDGTGETDDGTGEADETAQERRPSGTEPVNLAGVILERGSRVPLAGADVYAVRGMVEVATATDVEGRFEFRGLEPGTWIVESQPAGYDELSSPEEVAEGERTDVTYFIERASYGEYTYEVREEAVRREVSRQTLTVTEINRVPGNNGDAIKVIQNLPGFARAPFNGGSVVIRGSSPEDSRIFVEGVWIPVIFHFGGLTSVINSDLLDEIEYIPGAFSVEYGRATGGVINVETRPPRTDGYHGYVDVDIFDTGVLIEGPIAEDWSFFASARRSYIDAIIPAVIPEDAGLSLTVAPVYWDYQFKLQWDPEPEHSVNLFVFGSNDRLAFLVEEPPADPSVRGNIQTNTQFHRVRLEYNAEITEQLSNRLVLAGGFQELNFEADGGDELFFLLDTVPLTFRNTLEWRIADNLRLRPGLDIEDNFFEINVRAPRPVKEGELPVGVGASEIVEARVEATIYEPAMFVELEWDIFDNWLIVPGVRAEWYRTVGEWAFDGRLSTRWGVAEDWTLKAAFGTFHQSPVPDETSEDFGNPDLGLERAFHYVAGVEYAFTEYLSADVQLFFKDLDNLVARSDDVVTRDGEQVPEVYDNRGEGRIYGAELLFRHELANNFFGWVAYTYSVSERRDAPDEDYRLFSLDQTHNLALVASYELPRNWAIGARFRYVSGIPRTPVIGATFDADADTYVRIPGATSSTRVDAFHSLDLRVDKRWIFDRWQLELYLDISNVYNRANPETISYNFDFSQSAVTSGLPIIPSLGIRGSF